MGFVRHELGVRLRIKRIPALHVSLDDSAARGTRVLQIIEELGQGRDSAGEALADAPRAETLPTPVPRRRREGDAEAAGDGATGLDGEVVPAAAEMPVHGRAWAAARSPAHPPARLEAARAPVPASPGRPMSAGGHR